MHAGAVRPPRHRRTPSLQAALDSSPSPSPSPALPFATHAMDNLSLRSASPVIQQQQEQQEQLQGEAGAGAGSYLAGRIDDTATGLHDTTRFIRLSPPPFLFFPCQICAHSTAQASPAPVSHTWQHLSPGFAMSCSNAAAPRFLRHERVGPLQNPPGAASDAFTA